MRQRSEIMALRIAATRAVCALPRRMPQTETRWRRGGMNPQKPFRVYTLSGRALKPSMVRNSSKGCAKDRIRLSKDAPLKPTWRVCSARTIPIVL